jgi:hypothetical protein
MHPIYIFDGLERHWLVVAGSELARGHERVAPTRARAILEAALRRRDPRLMRGLRAVLRVHGRDADIASRQLALLIATGSMGGNLVLVRERASEAPRLDPPLECLPPEPAPPEPPEPIFEDGPEDEPPPARTSIRVSLFFDGTANNRANTRARLNNTQAFQDNADQGSFQNAYTNVSKLETLCRGDDGFAHSYSIYVEGIGTTNGAGDSTMGLGLGTGATGVPAKVIAGVNELLRSIRELGIARGVIIDRIHLDAFGFSRGAAAARYFVHYILTENPLQPRIEAGGHPVEQLQVNFVGLFDTVASYGIVHSNDTAELHLDAITAALKVVHLAAGEEHRANFRLTDIASAIGAGTGIEIYLPGVHSDIGGGYVDFSDETDLIMLNFNVMWSTQALEQRFAREREWLIDSGWYLPTEIAEVDFWNRLKVSRRWIRNRYDRIPLQHMADFAIESGLTFDPIATHHPIPPALHGIRDTVAAHVAAHRGGGSTAEHWINMRSPAFRVLRNQYLHFSAYYGATMGANDPQFDTGNALTGNRQRIVQAG